MSENILTSKGLVQSCCISSILFKIYIDIEQVEGTRKLEKMGVKITNESFILDLHFIDDQVEIAQDKDGIEYLMRKLLNACTEWSLNNNFHKTKNLISGCKNNPQTEKCIKFVSQFNYFKSELQESERERKIRTRFKPRRRAIVALNSKL